MKTEDIKFPAISDSFFNERSPFWSAIYAYESRRVRTSCHKELKENLENTVIKMMRKYAVETAALNAPQQPVAEKQPATDPQPFDLEAAKRGEPLVTRDGRKAKFIAYVPESEKYPVAAIIEGSEGFDAFTRDGKWSAGIINSTLDLFMAPRPMRTVYVNFYPCKPTPNAVVWNHKLQAEYNVPSNAIAVAVPVQIPA